MPLVDSLFFSGPDSDEGSYALFHGDRASQVRGFHGENKGSSSVNTKIACNILYTLGVSPAH